MSQDLFDHTPPPSMVAGAVIVDELAGLGVCEVVCCPGSRSAPLAYAAALLESEGRIRLHIRVDERAAGFFALGLAKAASRAVAIITTSGTAVANLAPALAEARYGQVPLIAVSADRPSTLVGTGANQTANQVGIFGNTPIETWRISSQDNSPDAWRACVQRAVVTSEGRLSGRRGPVHLNVELSEPLIGDPGPISPGVGFQVDHPTASRAVHLDPGPRTVIVAGDMGVDEGRWWAEQAHRTQIPLLAEPSSNARQGSAAVAGYRYLLAGFLPQIERVIIAGHPTLHRSITALLTRKDKEIIAVNSSGQWPDPGWGVSRVLPQVQLSMGDPGWMNTWASADGRLRTKINEHLSWGGQALAASVVEALGDGDALVLGASHPIRDADMAPISPAPPRVYANRGLAGIDGTIATATGIATGLGTPVVALMGDLTAFHDLTSLAVPALETSSDLSVVVADDNGGSIFAGMEYGASRVRIGTYADYFERLFAVPSRINLADVARGFSVPVVEVNSPAQLSAALTTPWSGVRFLHVPLERQSRVNQERDLVQWGREALTEMES